uniref:Metastasis-associated in colon cancer protein 1 n=1 Tax=Geotrypetes seraphini TaxID=260995 RepID=A0A6P8QHC4_GEOSA|nr:metastasis-associated in colon cancer protein 1 [Geotrypetes seraphini]XP_033786818.1 metastasis-associated in colon cancer protein 1 [Geotrypetes seraphini]
MSSTRSLSFRSGGISRSRSEGTLIDLEDGRLLSNNNLTDKQQKEIDLLIDWSDVFQQNAQNVTKKTNPFWNHLSGSNPFLDDVAQTSDGARNSERVSILKEDPHLLFRDTDARDSFASSGDELDIDYLLKSAPPKKTGRSKSVSDVLDILDGKEPNSYKTSATEHILTSDLEWLQNDREAYKMAWLSHRQLTRSCLDLSVMSQSPGWAQTQATDTQVVCRVDHQGGSVQLPNSDISVHVPVNHVTSGEFQEVGLKAILDPPSLLNHDLSSSVSPLLEITLSNLNTMEALLLEMKIAAEVKQDPFSQVMAEIVCLHSYHKDGPFEKLLNCYIYNDTIQVKLPSLNRAIYVITVAQAKANQLPPTSVWKCINKTVTVGIYGPKYIHPSFTTVFAVFGHNYTPEKLTVCDIKKGRKNLPPVVFQLWGKHQILVNKLQNLSISFISSDFRVKSTDQNRQISEERLKAGKMVYMQFPFSSLGNKEIKPFFFTVQIQDPQNNLVTEFKIKTPNSALSNKQGHFKKRKEVKSSPLPLTMKYPKFQDKTLKIKNYAVTLKTVLRQSKIEYLLEYFKGETIALLGEDKVKAIGQTKTKEWYVGVLRDKIGLVHCKNVKIISKEQVIDFSEVHFTTKKLLQQSALPFKKLTYIYSSVLSTVSEKVHDWRALADVLGYTRLSIEEIDQMQAETESERVMYVVKKLKEDCHSDSKKRKFHYELMLALLKMDCQGLVACLTQDTVILTTAVQLGIRWRELAEKLARLTKQQIEAYEVPHQGKSGEVNLQMMWKPAYDFLYTWAAHYGGSYRDVLQDLQSALDKMKNPMTRQWRELTGALILVNCMEILRATAFPKLENE